MGPEMMTTDKHPVRLGHTLPVAGSGTFRAHHSQDPPGYRTCH